MARCGNSRLAPFDVNTAIADVLTLTRGELQRHDVSLETELSPGLEPVLADRAQLQQVIMNLIVNGIEAMTADMHRPRVLRISSRMVEQDSVLLAVADTGTGFEPGNMDRIFDAFFTTKPQRMGLGVSICRSIVEAHGGRLWASANVPRGAIFQFTMPLREHGS
jgi:signal transduction histidine kinase